MKRSLIAAVLAATLTTACGQQQSDVLQGYGEAEYVYLSSQDAGVVRELYVREGDVVEAGAPVFALDAERLSYGAQSAAAQRAAALQAVQTAQAEATLAQRNFARGAELAVQGFYPRARLDSDRAARDAANARLAQARREAAAAGAETGLAQERVDDLAGRAPAAGVIEQVFRRPGEVVTAGQPIVALLPPQNMKVRFFAPEETLARIHIGDTVSVACDGCSEPLAATVSYIAREPQFTPPVIYSLDQREKLVFLVEARLETAGPIRPGMPVDVRLSGDE